MKGERALQLEDVLDLEYLSDWEWSPTGRELACIVDRGGIGVLEILDRSGDRRYTIDAEGSVSSFDWHPGGASLVFVAERGLYSAHGAESGWNARILTKGHEDIGIPRHSPVGEHLAFVRGDALWIWNLEDGSENTCTPPSGKVVASGFSMDEGIIWSSDGSNIAFHFSDDHLAQHIGVCGIDGNLLWYSKRRSTASAALSWMDENTLLALTSLDRNTVVEFYTVKINPGLSNRRQCIEPIVIHVERALGTPGSLRALGAWPEPNGRRILFRSESDGWAHLFVYDVDDGSMEQATFGRGEDMGFVGDAPAWAPGGRYVCYASNINSPGERQLWLLDVDAKATKQLTDLGGTNVSPSWCPQGSPTIAFIHCDARRSADLWVADVSSAFAESGGEPVTEGEKTVRLSRTMPRTWSEDLSIEPREVSYEGAGGLQITGYMISPPDLDEEDEDRRYPALVWVHGGPVRQMRPGFHPSRSYALFHAFSQYLAHRGYITLAINFRGGIGYGREFRNSLFRKMGVDDVVDVVEAGRYLKCLPYVDSERVAVWGLSYGGYMTLTALTKYPEEFAMGVNVAGVYDFEQWTHWIQSLKGPWSGNFSVFFDGDPEESPETYFAGSPSNFIESLQRPLVSFHGTADKNVDFAQMDKLVLDCLRLGKSHDAHYYPDEVHTFARRESWADAFPRIEEAFDRYLKR